MKRVIIFGNGVEEKIHYVDCGYMSAKETLCGEPLDNAHIHSIFALKVTCKKCLKITGETKSKRPKSRKSLTPRDVVRMINGWHTKTTTEWAKEFKVTYQTVIKTAVIVHKEDPQLCSPKQHKGKTTRMDIAKQGILLYKKTIAK